MNRLRQALAGCTTGAWAGFLLVYLPVVGAVLFVGFAIPRRSAGRWTRSQGSSWGRAG